MRTNKLLAALLVLLLVLAAAVPALAEGETDEITPPVVGNEPEDPVVEPIDAPEPETMTPEDVTFAAGKVALRISTDKVVEVSGVAVITFEVLNGSAVPVQLMDVVPVYTSSSIISGIQLPAEVADITLLPGEKLAASVSVSINATKKASEGTGYAATVDCYYHNEGVATVLKVSAETRIIKTSPRVYVDEPVTDTGSKPKLIIESYTLSSERAFAGDPFTLTIVIRNTSDSRAVENLTVTIEDASNTVRPGNSGSNTFFVGDIGKEKSHTQVITLVTEPAAEAGTYTLSVNFDYETSNHIAYSGSETISVPVAQRLRVQMNEPTIYGDFHSLGDRISMFFSLNNLGKASLYNCSVTVESEGLTIAEPYFGGNIGPGSTMSADFDVVSTASGEVAGEIVVRYEDVYGVASEERLPFTVMVEEAYIDDPYIDMPSEPIDQPTPSAGLGIWLYVIIAAVVVAGVVVLIIVLKGRKNRRRRELEEA